MAQIECWLVGNFKAKNILQYARHSSYNGFDIIHPLVIKAQNLCLEENPR